jgi:hypothetical protein
MKKLDVFDPPMCCASGVCGLQVDKKLVRFAAAIEWLRSQGIQVERYNPAQQYDAFVSHPAVVKTINERGTQCLPLILADGEIVSLGSYPERAELAAWAGLAGGDAANA